MIAPDFRGGSIVNLMTSIAQALGDAPPDYPPLRALAASALQTRNVVLLVIDGMGYENLVANCSDGFFARHIESRITSVFPSTTATAITTFFTGTAPQQHGVTGWFTYFRELGGVITPLPYRRRGSSEPLTVPATEAFGHVPIFDRLRARSFVVSPQRIAHSEYSMAHAGSAEIVPFETLEGMFAAIGRIVDAAEGRRYVYAYWPELDRLAHEHGIGSAEASAHLIELDTAFGECLRALRGTDTTVIVVADHGFVDTRTEQAVVLDAHPALASMLEQPLCGEPRAAFCYVREESHRRFVTYVRQHLSEHIELSDSRTLLESGFFGLGKPHPQLHERIGDYVLIMKDAASIKDWLPGEERHRHVGVHGGTSAHEMYVPLIVAQV